MNRKKAKSGEWLGRTVLYLHEGEGVGRMGSEPKVDPGIQMKTIVEAEELNCCCKIIVVPPLTWFKRDNSYIVVQFGNSEMNFLKNE